MPRADRSNRASGRRRDGGSLTNQAPGEPSPTLFARARRLPAQRIAEGAAIGISLWCVLFIFQLLPGKAQDTEGVFSFAVVGIAIRVTRFGKYLWIMLALAAAVVFFVSESSISNVVAARWIRCDALPDSGIGAIVVLSAGVNPNGTMSSEALDHLLTALQLTAKENGPLLVTTTVHQVFPTGAVSSESDQAQIISLAGGRARWIHTRPGKSTRDEAIAAADSLSARGISHVAVIASPMHTRRACGAFEAVGLVVTCIPARSRSPGGMAPGPWPRDRLTVFGEWVYELAGTAKYRMKGWLAQKPSRQSDSASSGGVQKTVAPSRQPWCE